MSFHLQGTNLSMHKLRHSSSKSIKIKWCNLSICIVYEFKRFATFGIIDKNYSFDLFVFVHLFFAKSSSFYQWKCILLVRLYRFGFWSAPLSLGYFVGEITPNLRFSIICQLQFGPSVCLLLPWQRFLSVPAISYGNGFALPSCMATVLFWPFCMATVSVYILLLLRY